MLSSDDTHGFLGVRRLYREEQSQISNMYYLKTKNDKEHLDREISSINKVPKENIFRFFWVATYL